MQRPNLYDRLKVIAILTMIVDHVGYVFFPELLGLRLVGRIAFPIFLFLVGFNGKYIWRWDLLGRAIVVQIPIFVLSHWFGFGSMALNILFGIIIGRGVLSLVQKFPLSFRNFRITSFAPYSTGYIFIAIFTMMLIIIHPWLAQFLDYGSFVILLPLIGYLIQNVKNRQIPPTPLYQGGRIKYLLIFLYSIVVLVFLFKFTWEVFGFSLPQLYVLGVFFVLLLCIFFVLGQANYFLPVGKKIDRGLLFLSKNALLIYVFHLIFLGIIKLIYLSIV